MPPRAYRVYGDDCIKLLKYSHRTEASTDESTLLATTQTRRQNTAAQAVVRHGRAASGVDEFGDSC